MIIINIQAMPSTETASVRFVGCSNYYTVILPNSTVQDCQAIVSLDKVSYSLRWRAILFFCSCVCCILLTSAFLARGTWDRKILISRQKIKVILMVGHFRVGQVWEEVPRVRPFPLWHWTPMGSQVKEENLRAMLRA